MLFRSLEETVRYKPYRIQRIRPLTSTPCNDLALDALLAKTRELLAEWVQLGISLPFPPLSKEHAPELPAGCSSKDVLGYLDSLTDPEQVADLVSCAVLSGPRERQTILETVNLEARLKRLIHYLMAEITQHRKSKSR